MPFKCVKCGYGMNNKGSGIPFMCPACHSVMCFITIGWDEYCKLATTDGEDNQ